MKTMWSLLVVTPMDISKPIAYSLILIIGLYLSYRLIFELSAYILVIGV